MDGRIESILGISMDCLDANALAAFYVRLSGWEQVISGEEWAGIRTPHGLLLVFQTVEGYVPPVWPWESGKQQQMAHMDFYVEDLDKAVAHAMECGATRADTQYFDTSTVMLDPAGHPFCLSTVKE